MKRTFTWFAAATVGLAMLAGCGGPSSGGASGGNEATGETIKIGVNYELSGPAATYGRENVEGIEMAIAEINAAGGVKGKKIEIVKYDNKSEPAEATTLATKAITEDKVLAVLGPATSGAFKATIPVANANKVPVISGSATADDVTVTNGKLQEYAFRTCFNDSFQGTGMANYAAQKLNAKKAVIIKDTSSDYGKGLAENFKKQFEATGGTIVAEEAYVEKDTDFNAVLTRIKGQEFDVVYVPGYYNEVGLIIKQARAQGIDKPILGGDGFDSPVIKQLAGDSASNVFYSNHYSSLDKDPKIVKFIGDFKAKYKKEPSSFNALGYDLGKFVADGLNRADSLNSVALQKALAGTKDFAGVTGTFSIDANHNPVKSIVVVGLNKGNPATAEKI